MTEKFIVTMELTFDEEDFDLHVSLKQITFTQHRVLQSLCSLNKQLQKKLKCVLV